MPTLSHLKSLQALELAVRTGSLKAAAEQLGITPAAVGQRIKSLEDYLGFDLLVRGRSGIRPTREAGQAVAHINAAFRELDTATKLLDFERVHEIHVVADTDWAELWLKPRLPEFKAQHPNIRFCINGIGDVPVRLGQSDLEVWFGETRGGSEDIVLFRDYLLPVATISNKRRFEAQRSEGLEGLPLFHLDCYKSDPQAIGWPEWIARHGYRKTAPERGIHYAHAVQALEAVYSDAGFLICGLGLILPQIQSGKLVLPFAISQGMWTSHAYRAAFRNGSERRAQVQQFRNWLMHQSEDTTAQLGFHVERGLPPQ